MSDQPDYTKKSDVKASSEAKMAPLTEAKMTPLSEAKMTPLNATEAILAPLTEAKMAPLKGAKELQAMLVVPYEEGTLDVPLYILNGLLPLLNPSEQAVYLRLYQLSHGCGKSTCCISLPDLSKAAGIGARTAARAIDGLVKFGLVERLESGFGKWRQGNLYRVHLPATFVSEARIVQEERERERRSLSLSSPSRTRRSPAKKRERKSGSRYTRAERLAFVEWQKAQGVAVRSVPSLADHYASGKMDEEIAAWQEEQARRARLAEHDNNPCPKCAGTNWEYLPKFDKVRPCPLREAAKQAAGGGAR